MSDSSDSDVIRRSRSTSKPKARYSEDSYESLDDERDNNFETEYDPLFLEIFGTGKEYAFIYENENENMNMNMNMNENMNMNMNMNEYDGGDIDEDSLDIEDCYSYIKKQLPGIASRQFEITVIDLLIRGYAVEYIAFHLDKMTIRDCYIVKDLIEEYKQFIKIKGTDCLRASQIQEIRNYEIKGLLNISDYICNLIENERVNEPKGSIQLNKAELQKVINQISKNPIFIDRVLKSNELRITGEHDTYSPEALGRLYCTDTIDEHNHIRMNIVSEAFKNVHVDQSKIKKTLSNQGIIHQPGGLNELTNIIISLKGMKGTYAGLFLDNSFCKISTIDENGNILQNAIFNEREIENIQNFIKNSQNIIVTSNNTNIKYLIQNIGVPSFYIPLEYSLFDDHKGFSVSYNIALAVQNPVIYFSRLYHNSNTNSININSINVDKIVLKRGILIAAATSKLDWKATIEHQYGFTLFNLLNISLAQRYFDYANIDSLSKLKDIFSEVEFSNICTYFNLQNSTDPLDRTYVHPKNYSIANVLCKGFNLQSGTTNSINSIISNPSQLRGITIDGDNLSSEFINYKVIKMMLMHPKESIFTGASDCQIFKDIVPQLNTGIHQGTIKKVGEHFYLCDVNGATVYCKRNGEFTLNQIVDINIISEAISMLSYSGQIEEVPQNTPLRFIRHPLFNAHKVIFIRASKEDGCCVVVCSDLNYSLKLREVENGYLFRESKYSSIDDFIHGYVKDLYQTIYDIKRFKYYFETKSEAEKYVSDIGNYLKYAIYISKESEGYLEFLFGKRKVFIKIDGSKLVFKNRSFANLDEFIRFVKSNSGNL